MSFTILIVDDSATTRGLIRRSIQLAGLPVTEVYEAAHGRDAFDQLQARRVNLVLADLHMPEMTGTELAHAMHTNPATATIPLAIITAEPSALRIAALREAGVKGYLRKPCTPESLRNLIKPFVEAHHGACLA